MNELHTLRRVSSASDRKDLVFCQAHLLSLALCMSGYRRMRLRRRLHSPAPGVHRFWSFAAWRHPQVVSGDIEHVVTETARAVYLCRIVALLESFDYNQTHDNKIKWLCYLECLLYVVVMAKTLQYLEMNEARSKRRVDENK